MGMTAIYNVNDVYIFNFAGLSAISPLEYGVFFMLWIGIALMYASLCDGFIEP